MGPVSSIEDYRYVLTQIFALLYEAYWDEHKGTKAGREARRVSNRFERAQRRYEQQRLASSRVG